MNRQLHRFKQLLSIALIFCLLMVSCKKDEKEKPSNETTEKWPLYSYQIFSEKGYFYESSNGIITYRNDNHVYSFDPSGKLISHFEEKISNLDPMISPFMKDGSFYVTYRVNTFNTIDTSLYSFDYLWAYYRGVNNDYSRTRMYDIRKKIPSTYINRDFLILDIQPDNLKSGTHNAAWILSMKYDSIDYKPVISHFSGIHVIKEYTLPEGAPFGKIDVSNDVILVYGNECWAFNRNMEFLGNQNMYRLVPGIKLYNNFIFMSNGEYYTSSDGLTLKEKIPGFPNNEEKIFQSRDNFLFYRTGFYCVAVDAFSSKELSRIDIRNSKMPVPANIGVVVDFYITRNGISYIVKRNGIIVAK
jgi:hypothetical protein